MIPSQGMRRQLVSIAITRKLACHRKTSTKHDAGKLQNNLREKKPAKQSAWEPGTWSHATSRPTLICLSSCIFAFMCLSIYVFVYFSICVFLHLWVTQPLSCLSSHLRLKNRVSSSSGLFTIFCQKFYHDDTAAGNGHNLPFTPTELRVRAKSSIRLFGFVSPSPLYSLH